MQSIYVLWYHLDFKHILQGHNIRAKPTNQTRNVRRKVLISTRHKVHVSTQVVSVTQN